MKPEKSAIFTSKTQAYCSLVKPGIIMGNAITAVAGFALASKGNIDFSLFLAMILGLSLIIASGCVFNNYIDRDADQKMLRTHNRAIPRGAVSSQSAIAFAIILGLLGASLLFLYVNVISAVIAILGFAVYVLLYSFLKYQTTYGTLIGSIAGAVPPVVGYCAVSNCLDVGAMLLFVIIALWQMPHFFAIAIYRFEDYAAASIPVLPIKKGMLATKIQMLLYVIAFSISSLMLTACGYTGIAYTVTASILGVAWLVLSLRGFKTRSDKLWARKMFIFSLAAVTALCSVIPFSVR